MCLLTIRPAKRWAQAFLFRKKGQFFGVNIHTRKTHTVRFGVIIRLLLIVFCNIEKNVMTVFLRKFLSVLPTQT